MDVYRVPRKRTYLTQLSFKVGETTMRELDFLTKHTKKGNKSRAVCQAIHFVYLERRRLLEEAEIQNVEKQKEVVPLVQENQNKVKQIVPKKRKSFPKVLPSWAYKGLLNEKEN